MGKCLLGLESGKCGSEIQTRPIEEEKEYTLWLLLNLYRIQQCSLKKIATFDFSSSNNITFDFSSFNNITIDFSSFNNITFDRYQIIADHNLIIININRRSVSKQYFEVLFGFFLGNDLQTSLPPPQKERMLIFFQHTFQTILRREFFFKEINFF